MRAVAYRVRCLLRASWRQALVLGLIVGTVSGVVLALAAGAARTASAPDRYTVAQGGGFDGTIQQGGGPPRTAEVAALPGVASAQSITFLFAELSQANGEPAGDVITFAGSYRADGLYLVAGREPDASRPEEFVATRSFATSLGGEPLGEGFDFSVLSQEQADRAGYDASESEEPRGTRARLTLVGIVDGPSELQDPSAVAVVAPSLIAPDDGVALTIMSVGLRPGTDLGTLRSELDSLPEGQALSLEPAQLVSQEVRTAVEGQARGFWLLTAVAGLAGLVVLGQLISRSVRLSTEEGPRLSALGFNTAQVVAESAARAAIPVVGGAVVGVALATALSPVFPTGFVRRIEPHPGVRLDAAVLSAGAATVIVVLILWTVAALLVASRPRGPQRPSQLVEWVAARCRSGTAATGLRFAFTRSGRDRGSVRATLVGLLATGALLFATVVFSSSLARLVSDGHRFGQTYDLFFGSGGESVPDETVVTRLEEDSDVSALALYGSGQARIGERSLGLVGIQPVKGDIPTVTLSGRLPRADDEIALGRLAARALGAEVGVDVAVAADDGPRRFRVTGLVVVPPVEEIDGVGQGAVLTMGGLRRADPEATASSGGITLRRGASLGTAQRLGAGEVAGPSVILNLARIRHVPVLLAGLVGVLAVLTIVHVMLTSIHHRRRDVALLRSLGADRRWIGRCVHWQATSFSLVPLALGVPLGLIMGRLVFGLFANSVGAVPSASFPYAVLFAAAAGFVILANAVAWVTARRARRLAPAPLLASE